MKRIELFKKTGIRITAIGLSAALVGSFPAVISAASEQIVQSESAAYGDTGSEYADPDESEDSNEDENDDSGDEDDSGDGGTDDSGDEDDSGDGGTDDSGDSGTDDSGDSGTDDSGDSGTDDSGDSGTDDSGDSGTDDSGDSGTDDSGDGGTDDSGDSGTKDSGGGDNSEDDSSGGSTEGGGGKESGEDSGSGGKGSTKKPSQPSSDPGTGKTSTTGEIDGKGSSVDLKTTDTDKEVVTFPEDTDIYEEDLKDRETVLDPDETPTGYAQAQNYVGTNEQLIASQNIVSGLSIIRNDFRFYTVDKELAFSSSAQPVLEQRKSTSRQIGALEENDALYILSREKDGWLYVESGNVRGFLKEGNILEGANADRLLESLQRKLDTIGGLTGEKIDAADSLHFAKETVPAGENSAFAYKRCTTKSTVIDKKYVVAKNGLSILEEASGSAREVGNLEAGGLAYMILPVSEKWVYVESGNVRGFAKLSDLTTGSAASRIVKESGETSMQTASQLVPPKENAALYYSLNSVHDGLTYSNVRTELIQTAAECIGNPYVWGGTSLTNGADCSGFVQTLYSMFGYSIPRVAEDQSRYGTQIPVSDAAPGDLVFFASNGYVYHVALYAGDGMTIEAYSENRGIIATSLGNRDVVWATRVIDD